MPFPNQVNVQPAPAVAGDFASTNPRATVDAGPGGLVAGPAGVTVGRFAWLSYTSADTDNAPAQANSFATSTTGLPAGPAGIVHREQQGLITTYLTEFAMSIPGGFPVTLFNAGDFWVKNDGSTQVFIGQYAFANFADGRVFFGAGSQGSIGSGALAGTSASISSGSIGPQSTTFTGSITGNILTITGSVVGTVVVGGSLSGTSAAGNVVTATQIVAQLSGTPGGVGTYSLNIAEQTVSSTTITETSGLLTVTTLASGTVSIGMLVTGTASGTVPTFISAFGTGSGGTGTYIVSATQTVAAASTFSGQTTIQTKWIATSSGLAGELIKISSWIYG